MVKLNVLDYAQVDEGSNPYEAIRHSTELAKHADNVGFHRFWVAEHHNLPAFASSSPEVLMMHIADSTGEIRVGSGGVMLPHYSPFAVSENIRMIEAAHKGRVDLGIGNTLGVKSVQEALDETTDELLDYNESVKDVKHFLTSADDPDFRHNELTANPNVETTPEMFMLSASVKNAKFAAKEGIGYCYGIFPYASPDKIKIGKRAFNAYRDNFVPSEVLSKPKNMFSIFASVAETVEEAEAAAKAIDLWMLGQDNFEHFDYFPSVEYAENYEPTPNQAKRIEKNRSRMVVGSRDTIKGKLDEYADAFDADEIMVCMIMPGIERRKKGLSILADVYGL